MRGRSKEKTSDQTKTLYVKIGEMLHRDLQKEAERRGYPWTLTSVAHDAIMRGMDEIKADPEHES
jgi:hypothetical protein